MPEPHLKRTKIAFFGHFGAGNFGNEATFQAMLWNIRRFVPDAEMMCVTTFPMKVAEDYGIAAIPANDVVVESWDLRNPVAKFARKLFVGIPSEIFRWFKAVKALWHVHIFIVVGTGLLTDSFCLNSWGPYSVFKWSVAAKLCRCKVFFVSAGAGPLDTSLGRTLIKSALSMGNFRSYRDQATRDYLEGIGFRRQTDRVFPDLAFSLPPTALPQIAPRQGGRPVVGLGLMEFGGLYGIEKTTANQYSAYLDTLVGFVERLLFCGYDIRLLIGELTDEHAVAKFQSLLKDRTIGQDRVTSEPITSTENLLSQLAETDFVVATRFHNVLLSLLLNKPTISISFHHKCSSLMAQMGLSGYCQDIQKLSGQRLAEQFTELEKNANALKRVMNAKVAEFRNALEEQYSIIFNAHLPLPVPAVDQPRHEFASTTSGHERS